MKLILEIQQCKGQPAIEIPGSKTTILLTPPIDENYWMFRVKLSETQAIVGFPKFGMIGIGFAKEKDWNTNLPAKCDAPTIFAHIKHNKGRGNISDADCLRAIEMIREAASKMKEI